MSQRQSVDVLEVVSRYGAGYFPLYDLRGRFFWARPPVRAVLPVNAEVLRRARRMGARGKKYFEIRYTAAVEEVIRQLGRKQVKAHSWVGAQVVEIYRALHLAGMLRTLEAWERISPEAPGVTSLSRRGLVQDALAKGRPAGALLGIVLPGTFVAETMYGLVSEASKVCLCRLVEDCHVAGFEMIDVQTPHDVDEYGMPRALAGRTAHPCIRLGEVHVGIGTYLRAFAAAWRRGFGGGVEQWVAAVRATRESGEAAPKAPAQQVQQARRWLACGGR